MTQLRVEIERARDAGVAADNGGTQAAHLLAQDCDRLLLALDTLEAVEWIEGR